MVVTAGIVVLLAQLVRVFMPLGTALAHDLHGVRGYALGRMGVLAAFGVSAVAMLVAFRAEALRRRGQVLAAGMVVAASVVVQIVHPIPVWLGIAALGLALGAVPTLASAVRRVAGNDASARR